VRRRVRRRRRLEQASRRVLAQEQAPRLE